MQRLAANTVAAPRAARQATAPAALPVRAPAAKAVKKLPTGFAAARDLSVGGAGSVRAASARSVVAAAAPEKPTILVAEKLGDEGVAYLEQYANVDCSYDLTPDELKAKISLCDAVIIRSGTKITREVFEAGKGRLKVVGRAGVGVDNVDLTAATEHGCLVVNAPTANTVAAAEHGIALLCALCRKVPGADASMRRGEWKRAKYTGVSIVGKTISIIGFGKVGLEVARRAKGLGMKVLAYDPYAARERAEALGVQLVSFDEALAQSDFLSLHMPLLDSTRDMFNDETFKKCKKGIRIVNVARGGVINEPALARALDEGIVAGAALDVFSSEPPEADNELLKREDVVLTPHLGASTEEAQAAVAMEVAEAVVNALNGELASTAVNAPMVPREVMEELQPYVSLADSLGRAVVQCLGGTGVSDLTITYDTPRGDELDTRLLRAMVLKGVLETVTEQKVNLVNADYLAKQYGIRVTETTRMVDGKDILSNLTVSMGGKSKFSGALDAAGKLTFGGAVVKGAPFITCIGETDVEIACYGGVILCKQRDQPGVIGAVATTLAQDDINVSFMTVGRDKPRGAAVMAVGVDEDPSPKTLATLREIPSVDEIAWISFHTA
ncbi:unnamed protein product [Pedinophyceae sp. YPF-701]|nr:unnamed protein product [Pedinophyceae sp. YPF-701]